MKTKVWEKRGKSEGFYRGKSKVKYYREMLYRKTETAQKCCIGLFYCISALLFAECGCLYKGIHRKHENKALYRGVPDRGAYIGRYIRGIYKRLHIEPIQTAI